MPARMPFKAMTNLFIRSTGSRRVRVTPERSRITVRGISVELVRKNIKHLYLRVYPPDGRVRVSAPRRLDNEAVRSAIVSRLEWITRQQKRLNQPERHQSRFEMITGESHYVQGRRYRLNIIEHKGPASVRLGDDTTIELRVRPGTIRDKREAVLHRWYRQRLREQIPDLIAKWEPEIGLPVTQWRIKKMRTRWGSCNIKARRIWLNLELAKKPAACLEYIVLHEMVHFLERYHNARFKELMDRLMPRWRLCQEELNQVPLLP